MKYYMAEDMTLKPVYHLLYEKNVEFNLILHVQYIRKVVYLNTTSGRLSTK